MTIPDERTIADVAAGDDEQFEIWRPRRQHNEFARPLSAAEARAAVPPGWWPLVRPLFYEGASIQLYECRVSRWGELVLEVIAADDDDYVRDAADAAAIERLAKETCGCCGQRGNLTPMQIRLGDPVNVACPDCARRLRDGESLLDIAETYFRLDGSRRDGALRERARRSLGSMVHDAPTPQSHDTARPIMALPAAELRALVRQIRDTMRQSVGLADEAIVTLSMLGAAHVGGGLLFGPRLLVLGPSGYGNLLIDAFVRALEPFALTVVSIPCAHLTAAGWSGTLTIGSALHDALGTPPWADPGRTHKAIVVLDELHVLRLDSHVADDRNTFQHRRNILAGLDALATGALVPMADSGASFPSQGAFVIGVATVDDSLGGEGRPSVRDLANWGLPPSLMSRLAEEVIMLPPLTEAELAVTIRRAPPVTNLLEVARRLGVDVLLHESAVGRTAHVVAVARDGSTLQTGIAILVRAVRRALLTALDDPAQTRIEITPDTLDIAPDALRKRPGPEPPPGGFWRPMPW